MGDSENTRRHEFGAAIDAGAAKPLRIRFKLRAPCPGTAPSSNPVGDQCFKPTPKACESLERNRIGDDGIQKFRVAKHVAECSKMPELSIKNGMLSSNPLPSSEQEIECGGDSAKHNSVDTLCRLMRCNAAINGTKRPQLSLGSPTSNRFKRSKRMKRLLLTKRKPSSIDGLPDNVLVEILCRLQCNKLVVQCKSVSKRWLAIIENHYFIGRFLQHMEISFKETGKIRTLMNREAEEFPPKMSSALLASTNKLLTPVFEGIKSIHGLRVQPVVVATYNDLVLCCASQHYQCYYYICNAYTMECVALPPTPSRHHKFVWVGFICDSPNYNCEDDISNGNNSNMCEVNAATECRCTVVRILPPGELTAAKDKKCNLNVEFFSSETGEWTELFVPSPKYFSFCNLDLHSFAYHGRIYWAAEFDLFLVGLGPFYDHNDGTSGSSSGNGIDHKLCFTLSDERLPRRYVVQYLGVSRGRVQMCGFYKCSDKILHVFELEEQDGVAGQLRLSKHNEYPLEPGMFQNSRIFGVRAFDPYNKDIMYFNVRGDVFKCNIHTREWLKIAERWIGKCNHFWPLVFPWWPTPLPTLYGNLPHGPSASIFRPSPVEKGCNVAMLHCNPSKYNFLKE